MKEKEHVRRKEVEEGEKETKGKNKIKEKGSLV